MCADIIVFDLFTTHTIRGIHYTQRVCVLARAKSGKVRNMCGWQRGDDGGRYRGNHTRTHTHTHTLTYAYSGLAKWLFGKSIEQMVHGDDDDDDHATTATTTTTRQPTVDDTASERERCARPCQRANNVRLFIC